MSEFAFDVTMQAVIRVRADTEAQARQALMDSWGDETWVDVEVDDTHLTVVCLDSEAIEPNLFEVDDKEV